MDAAYPNFLLLTFDSCRFDVARTARTPVLDSYGVLHEAQTPSNFTYGAHLAFFAGILPNSSQPLPFFNRFTRQLIGLVETGETRVAKEAAFPVDSRHDIISGLTAMGVKTIGAGAMNWFRQGTLTDRFESFQFTGTDAEAQIDFLLSELEPDRKFFGFINFGETHFPFTHAENPKPCNEPVLARLIDWPPAPKDGVRTGRDNPAFARQVEALEFIDSRLARLFSSVPENTVVVACADHGECLGEDGYWGHGVNHPQVLTVPMYIFRLDGNPVA